MATDVERVEAGRAVHRNVLQELPVLPLMQSQVIIAANKDGGDLRFQPLDV